MKIAVIDPNTLSILNRLDHIVQEAVTYGVRGFHETCELRIVRQNLVATLDEQQDMLVEMHDRPLTFEKKFLPVIRIGSTDTHHNRVVAEHAEMFEEIQKRSHPEDYDVIMLIERSTGKCLGYLTHGKYIDQLNEHYGKGKSEYKAI